MPSALMLAQTEPEHTVQQLCKKGAAAEFSHDKVLQGEIWLAMLNLFAILS